MKYRDKVTNEIIEAFQYDGDIKDRNGKYYIPDWAIDAFIARELHYEVDELYLKSHIVNVGDYLVKKDGYIFVSSQKYFEPTYYQVIDECDLPFTELGVEGVTEEEIPCCVVDIMAAEKLIPLLISLVEEKDEEIKNFQLELKKLKNFGKTKSNSFFETEFRISFLKDKRVLKAVRDVVTERKKFEPLTRMVPRNIPRRKNWDSEFGDFYCPNCFEQVKENEERCPNCHQRLEVDIKKNDDIKDKINDIREELLKHGEFYDSFVASIKSAIIERKNKYGCTILNGDLSRYILDFLIGEEK